MSLANHIKEHLMLGVPLTGSNTINMSPGQTLQSIVNSLSTRTWVTPVVPTADAGVFTCTINTGESKVIVNSGDSMWTDQVASNYVWSANNVHWYNIAHAPFNTDLWLDCPYQGANLSAATCYLGKINPVTIVVHPGTYNSQSLQFTAFPVAYVNIVLLPGALFTGRPTPSMIFAPPDSGQFNVYGGHILGKYTLAFSASAVGITNIKFNDVILETPDVDISGGLECGNATFNRCRLQSSQDGLAVNAKSGAVYYNDCHLIGRTASFVGGVYGTGLGVRLFFGQSDQVVTGGKITMDTSDQSVFAFICDMNQNNTYRLKGVDIKISGANATSVIVAVCGSYSAAGNSNAYIDNCDIVVTSTAGTPYIAASQTWTGTPVVKLNNCRINGVALGGGGALTVGEQYPAT